MRKAILLVNLGTPLQPTKREVGKFLTKFLNDPFVIDLPWLFRKLLVNLIIVPFRTAKSTKMYKRLWTEEGSPISLHLNNLAQELEIELKPEMRIFTAMRYGLPNLRQSLQSILNAQIEQLYVFPLFPQYATSTTGSIIDLIEKEMKRLENPFQINIIQDFYNHPDFIQAFAQKVNSYNPEGFDHIIFSYHSLPERQVQRMHPEHNCVSCKCEREMPHFGRNCYKAQCYETTRLLAQALQLQQSNYSMAFQSRFSKKWIGPFTEDSIIQLAKAGKERILVLVPAFVADCLETLIEVQADYSALFKEHGGKELVLVESLNSEKAWAKAIKNILFKQDLIHTTI